MSIRGLSRSAIGGTITLARLPLEVAVSLLPGNGAGPGTKAGIAFDRVEAQLRDLAGAVLGDDVLREDAALRRIAADERERALELRHAAAQRAQEADERAEETHEQAEERRKAAAERARRQRASAQAQRNERAREAAKAERRRKAASAQARAKTDERIEEQAAAARLEQLEREAVVLDEQAGALTAEAEAQRLQDAATRRKAARKQR
jgi:hypothetical protein